MKGFFESELLGTRLLICLLLVVISIASSTPFLFFVTVLWVLFDLLNIIIKKISSAISSEKKIKESQSPAYEQNPIAVKNPIVAAKEQSLLSNFNFSERIIAISRYSRDSGIAFDFDNLQVCVYYFGLDAGVVSQLVVAFPISNLISVEIVEDGYSISQSTTTTQGGTEEKTSGLSMVGRAAVGGLLFGGVGAVIGGLSARTTGTINSTAVTNHHTQEMVRDVSLKLLINDTKKPIVTLKFLDAPAQKTDNYYKSVYQKIEHCDALLRVMLTRAAASKVTTP